MMDLGRMMAGGGGKRKRDEHDFYATPPDATRALIGVEGFLIDAFRLSEDAVWDPACGDGAIAKVLGDTGLPVIGTDLIDRGYGQGGNDFLAFDKKTAKSGVIVTNPPFNLAEEFIRHAKSIGTRYMALLLKSTYWHAARRQKLWRFWQPAKIYPLTWRLDFTEEGSPAMECMWCVWYSRGWGDHTHYIPLHRPERTGLL